MLSAHSSTSGGLWTRLVLRILKRMESTKKSRGLVVVVLVLVVTGLTALNVYQDHIIAKQRYELSWLMTHSTIRPDLIAADIAKSGKAAAQAKSPQTATTSVAEVPPSSKPAAPAHPVAKP